MAEEEQKPVPTEMTKSSMEILSELFSTFDAEPPVIVKKEKEEGGKKHKKSKKKHKHKDKKHKKKDKKRKRTDSVSSDSSAVDLAHLLIKRERQSPEKKIKLDRFLLPDEKVGEEPQITVQKFKFKSVIEGIVTEEKGKVKKEKGEEEEEGEITCSDDNANEIVDKKRKKKKRKREDRKSKKHSDRDNDEKKAKKSKVEHTRSKSKETRDKSEEKRSRSKERKAKSPIRWSKERSGSEYKSKDRDKDKEKYVDDYKSRDDYYRDRRDDSRSKNHDDYKHRYRENPFYKAADDSKARNSHEKDDHKWFTRERYRGYNEHEKDRRRYRDRSGSKEGDNHIDKKKLLEIARRNAIQMMKSGSLPAALTLGPQAQEKVLAAIKAGGKTIEELTDFCKTLSKKEELGELSSNSAGEDGDDSDVENKAFHHPFQLKDRPTSIIMNIKNSVPLPTKTAQERNSDLRLQFPVSSGTHHRKTENEWIPVAPKKSDNQLLAIKAAPAVLPTTPLAIEAPPPSEPSPPIVPTVSGLPGPQVFPMYSDPNVNIGAIVTQRLSAIRKLQENPYDVEALGEMHKSQKEMQSWAESKLQPGQFTGSTGANILSQAELASGYQTWAKKDQLQNAAPVSGGMGMHLLRKMGWNPGEGLGKEKTGALEPLLLEVKLNKKGLVASEEQKRRGGQKTTKSAVKTLESKHPVSLLGEFTAKKKLGAPEYTLCLESGPDHKKMFLFKVSVNGMECKPDIASPNKKQAKADAAKLCLQRLGILI